MNFTCPQCTKPLAFTDSGYSCSHCQTTFPRLNGLDWLVPHPREQLAEWRLKYQALLGQIDAEIDVFKSELKLTQLGVLTQKRLRKLLQAKVEHKKSITEILSPLTLEISRSPDLLRSAGIHVPNAQSLTGYYANIHRDWAWETGENAESLAVVNSLIASQTDLGQVLVLGGGACRLAYDIYQAVKPTSLIATDINPLLLLIAQRMVQGKSIKLYEFPLAPKDLESHAVLRKCVAPQRLDPGFKLLFADALRPPFAAQSFDTVITPWLIDILPHELSLIIRSVSRLLKPGGRWLNFGSLAFNHATPAINYSYEETLDLVESHGLKITCVQKDRIRYMQSPASHHARLETVVSFTACKQKAPEVPDATEFPVPGHAVSGHLVPEHLPDWLRDTSLPVPSLPIFQTARAIHTLYTDVLILVDQQRSIVEIAKIFGQRYQMSDLEAERSLRGFFAKLWEEGRTGKNF